MRTMFIAAALMLVAGTAAAQTPAHDPTERLNTVLRSDVAARVIDRIAQARTRQLPAQALENRAFELAAKGASSEDIERKIDGYAKAMELAGEALARGRGRRPTADEVAAGGDVITRGVSGQQVAEMARIAPADRLIAVPLFVLGALIERGLSVKSAVDQVKTGLARHETDAQMQAHVDALPAPATERNGVNGPATAAANRPSFAGAPAGVPANPGIRGKPTETPPVETPPVQTPPAPPAGSPPPSE